MNIVDALLKVALLGSAWVLWLLIGLSVASLGVMSERVLYFRRNRRRGGEALRRDLLRALRAHDPDGAERLLRDSRTVEGAVVAGAFAFRDGGSRAFADALEAELARARPELERGLSFLGTLGNNAPFIGLFGTVIGVIAAFHELGTAAARAGAMGNVMSGIAEALVATGVGIFVALPAVIAYNTAQKRIGDIEQETLSLGRLVSAWLETRERGGVVRIAAEPVPDRAVQPTEPHRADPQLAAAGD
ncbi:MAG: MotA/TolQ/ExbB proton channel family protein [Myxococcota bacterium]